MHLVAQTADQWITERLARRQINHNTAYNYRHIFADLVEFLGPDTNVEDVTRRDIERWLAQARRNGGSYSPASINGRANPVRAFFAWAADPNIGIITLNPTQGIERARTSKRFPRGLAAEDVERMLWFASGRDRTILLAGLHLGLRREELTSMRVEQWNRADGTYWVQEDEAKGSRERTLPVAGELKHALTRWVDLGLQGTRAGPMWRSSRTGGAALSYNQIGAIVAKAASEAGVRATPHSLRHTCGSDLVRAGAPISVVQWWLGHESLATTSLYVVPFARELEAFSTARSYLPEGMAA